MLSIRKAFAAKDIEALNSLYQSHPTIPELPQTEELGFIWRYIEIVKEWIIIIEKMRIAVSKKDKDRIMDLLAQGKVLRIQWDQDLFKLAMEILKKQSEISYYKEKARETKSIGLIVIAIQKAEQYNPADPDIPELEQLKTSIREIIEECLVALNVLEKPQMEAILNKAKGLEITNDLIDTLQMLLYEMDDDSFEELQFKVALKLGDKKLLLKRTILKKQREVMNIPNAAEVFAIQKCPIMQDPATWSRKSFLSDLFSREDRLKTFFYWTKERIHKPMSKISDKKQVEECVEIFKNILCYMGDKEHKTPTSCAQSIIHSGIHNAILRDEIFLQIMKQLTNNPNPLSAQKGWILLGYCLRAFSPVVTQNYIDYFIRASAAHPEQLLILMYTKILFEPTNFMQLNEIRAMLSYEIRS